jgi:hypothetical protein
MLRDVAGFDIKPQVLPIFVKSVCGIGIHPL